jgi:hypothetical protein
VALAAAVSDRLGHYTPLQSINSEDVITWSFFGPAIYGGAALRAAFLRWLLTRLRLPAEDTMASIDLWRRVPHPQKPSAPGPELDALLHGGRSVLFEEAKWGSPEESARGHPEPRRRWNCALARRPPRRPERLVDHLNLVRRGRERAVRYPSTRL